jgi:preprotein translocase SecE subunit
MADNKPAKAKTKRLVKDPETFRERALKASEDSGKPARSAGIKQAGGKIASPVAFLFKPLRAIGRVIFPAYFRNSWQELRLVTWPTWKQSRQLTFAVLVFAVIFGAIIALVDYGLDKVFRNILLK